jgi:hypothetical protein
MIEEKVAFAVISILLLIGLIELLRQMHAAGVLL